MILYWLMGISLFFLKTAPAFTTEIGEDIAHNKSIEIRAWDYTIRRFIENGEPKVEKKRNLYDSIDFEARKDYEFEIDLEESYVVEKIHFQFEQSDMPMVMGIRLKHTTNNANEVNECAVLNTTLSKRDVVVSCLNTHSSSGHFSVGNVLLMKIPMTAEPFRMCKIQVFGKKTEKDMLFKEVAKIEIWVESVRKFVEIDQTTDLTDANFSTCTSFEPHLHYQIKIPLQENRPINTVAFEFGSTDVDMELGVRVSTIADKKTEECSPLQPHVSKRSFFIFCRSKDSSRGSKGRSGELIILKGDQLLILISTLEKQITICGIKAYLIEIAAPKLTSDLPLVTDKATTFPNTVEPGIETTTTEEPEDDFPENGDTNYWIIGVVVGLSIFICLLTVVSVIYRKKIGELFRRLFQNSPAHESSPETETLDVTEGSASNNIT